MELASGARPVNALANWLLNAVFILAVGFVLGLALALIVQNVGAVRPILGI